MAVFDVDHRNEHHLTGGPVVLRLLGRNATTGSTPHYQISY